MAISLNGSSQYLTVPVNSAFEFGTGDFAVALKVNFDALPHWGMLLGVGLGASGEPPPNAKTSAWQIWYRDGATPKALWFYRFTGSVESYATFDWSPSASTNYDIAITRIGSDLKAYINGSQIGSTVTYTTSLNRINDNDPLTAGRFEWLSPNVYYWSGKISEIAIWKGYGLSAAEVTALSKGIAAPRVRARDLSFYAPLIRNLQDVRGGLAITNNNGATVANHPRLYL